jgi:hypothetical protein
MEYYRMSNPILVPAVNQADTLPKITFRVLPEQKKAVKAMCLIHNMSHQSFFRRVIDNGEAVLKHLESLESENE